MALFFSHITMMFLLSFFSEPFGSFQYGFLGSVVYVFLVAFWVYFILVAFYCFITKAMNLQFFGRVITAGTIVVIGYLASRGGDIVDGDFFKKFRPLIFFTFLLSSVVIIYVDNLLERK